MDRLCSICGLKKPEALFGEWAWNRCRSCLNYKKRQRRYSKKIALYNIKKDLSCRDCGDPRHWVLDFHHKDMSEKETTVSRMLSNAASMDKIMVEISKCEVLCSNCHRTVHYMRNGGKYE